MINELSAWGISEKLRSIVEAEMDEPKEIKEVNFTVVNNTPADITPTEWQRGYDEAVRQILRADLKADITRVQIEQIGRMNDRRELIDKITGALLCSACDGGWGTVGKPISIKEYWDGAAKRLRDALR